MKDRFDAVAHIRFSPRRTPRQKRSRIVVDKIIGTAKVLFEQEGYNYVSTNRIAEAANLSIGSLYQYFANCESIALAVYENACSEAAITIKRRLLEIISLPVEDALNYLVEWTFDILEEDKYALLQIINEVPALRSVHQPFSFGNLIHHTCMMFLEEHFTDVDRQTIAKKSYIMEKCFLGVIGSYLEEDPDLPKRSEVIVETTELMQQYVATLAHHRKPIDPTIDY